MELLVAIAAPFLRIDKQSLPERVYELVVGNQAARN
jgi:hypothetical protein